MSIGKVNKNGTFNNGAFYSIPDVNTLVQNSGGSGDLPTTTIADAGKAVVVDEEGKYALGEGGSGGAHYLTPDAQTGSLGVSYNDIKSYIDNNEVVALVNDNSQDSSVHKTFIYLQGIAKIEGTFYAVIFDNIPFTSNSINGILTFDENPDPTPNSN